MRLPVLAIIVVLTSCAAPVPNLPLEEHVVRHGAPIYIGGNVNLPGHYRMRCWSLFEALDPEEGEICRSEHVPMLVINAVAMAGGGNVGGPVFVYRDGRKYRAKWSDRVAPGDIVIVGSER
jgi:hypothetical protein